jgi:thiol-disulfide isomerase/thioredoxin
MSKMTIYAMAIAFLTALIAAPAIAQDKAKKTEGDQPKAKKAEGDQPKDKKSAGDEEKAEKKLSVGDAAPPLQIEKFLKGEPVKKFKGGHIYVVEFWSTWCGPCRATMPHMTDLQKKFKDKATFIGVNVWEREYNDDTLKDVQEFVKSNDEKMGYTVAFDGGNKATDKAYMKAAGQDGIPCAFIVTGDGKIAYIGHPADEEFEKTLQQLVDGKFDMDAAKAAAKQRQEEEEAMLKNREKMMKLSMEAQQLIEDGKIDDGMAKLDEIAKLVPKLASNVEMQKFQLLMSKGKYKKAFEIGRKLVEGPAKDNAMMLNAIAWGIVDPEADVEEPDVALATKAAELANKLSEGKNAAIVDTLARCYWVKGEKDKAIELQTKAVKLADDDAVMKKSLQKTLKQYEKDLNKGGKSDEAKKEGKNAKEEKEPKGKDAKEKKGEEGDDEDEDEDEGEEDDDD